MGESNSQYLQITMFYNCFPRVGWNNNLDFENIFCCFATFRLSRGGVVGEQKETISLNYNSLQSLPSIRHALTNHTMGLEPD